MCYKAHNHIPHIQTSKDVIPDTASPTETIIWLRLW
jgi:hypothetical protein